MSSSDAGRFIETRAAGARRAERVAVELVEERRVTSPAFARSWARYRLELNDRPPAMGATRRLRAERELIARMVDSKLGLEGPAAAPAAVAREQVDELAQRRAADELPPAA